MLGSYCLGITFSCSYSLASLYISVWLYANFFVWSPFTIRVLLFTVLLGFLFSRFCCRAVPLYPRFPQLSVLARPTSNTDSMLRGVHFHRDTVFGGCMLGPRFLRGYEGLLLVLRFWISGLPEGSYKFTSVRPLVRPLVTHFSRNWFISLFCMKLGVHKC